MAVDLYGFHRVADRMDELALDPRNREIVEEAARLTLEEHNGTTNELLNRLSFVTTSYIKTYKVGGRTGMLQPTDEYGRAIPRRRPAGTEYSIGLPLRGGADAVGGSYRARQKRTIQDIFNTMSDFVNDDLNWLRYQFLSAFFANAEYEFLDDEHGALPVKPLANGDGNLYQVNRVAGVETDNHLQAMSGTISDINNPFASIRKDLLEHSSENSGRVTSFVSDDLLPVIQNLTGFYELPDTTIAISANADQLVGSAPAVPFGEVMGYLRGSRVWVARYEPLNEIGNGEYILSLPENGKPALAMRQDPESNLQGFFARADREDHPYWERQYDRYAGFGAWNRVGALITQMGVAAYTRPADLAGVN